MVWSLLFCLVLLRVTRTWRPFVAALRNRRTLGLLFGAAVLLAINWLVFVLGILSDRVVDAALGYYINPLVTVTSPSSCCASACGRSSGWPWGSVPRLSSSSPSGTGGCPGSR